MMPGCGGRWPRKGSVREPLASGHSSCFRFNAATARLGFVSSKGAGVPWGGGWGSSYSFFQRTCLLKNSLFKVLQYVLIAAIVAALAWAVLVALAWATGSL